MSEEIKNTEEAVPEQAKAESTGSGETKSEAVGSKRRTRAPKQTPEEALREVLEARAELQAEQEDDEEGSEGKKKRRRHHHHHHHHHSKRRHRRRKIKKRIKRILLTIGLFVLIAAVAIGASIYAMYKQGKVELTAKTYNITAPDDVDVGNNGKYVIYNGERYTFNNNNINILFLGIDKKNSMTDSSGATKRNLSDVIAVCSINPKSGEISIINVPRDIMTDVSVYSSEGGYVGREKMQIAAAYSYGDGAHSSCVNSKEAVSRLFYNVPITIYISLNLDGVQDINDSVGGVDVVSPETIGSFVKGESYHLEGINAKYFVELRAMDRADANLLRNERQKVYMNAFLKKFITATKKDISVPVDLFNASAPYSCTNLNADKVTYLATEFIVNRTMSFNYHSVPVDVTQSGNHAENYVKEKEFYEMFLSVFYTKEGESSKTKTTAAPEATEIRE